MPPMRPCLGCGHMIPVSEKQSRCIECRKTRWGLGFTGERGSRGNWRGVRHRALLRDGFQCRDCPEREHLAVHHVDGDPRNDALDNLIVLCPTCHNRRHREAKGKR